MTPFLQFTCWREPAVFMLLTGLAPPHHANAVANGSVHRQKRDAPIRVTWLGHAGFEIVSAGGTRLLIDPWLEGNSAAPVAYRDSTRYSAPSTRPAAILVTHAHGDHDADAARLSRLSGAKVVATGDHISSEGDSLRDGWRPSRPGSGNRGRCHSPVFSSEGDSADAHRNTAAAIRHRGRRSQSVPRGLTYSDSRSGSRSNFLIQPCVTLR